MEELLPIIIKNIQESYFAKIDQEAANDVIQHIQELVKLDKMTVLRKLSRRPLEATAKWNLYAIAWRTIERTIEYNFKPSYQFKINGRMRSIKEIIFNERVAVLENGDRFPLISIPTIQTVPKREYQQLTLF